MNQLKEEIFQEWLSNFHLGWMKIAIFKGSQIFKVTDLRSKCRYFYIMADSRKSVMDWIMEFGIFFLNTNNYSKESPLKWFTCKKVNRGKVREYFEILRLLENELPDKDFPIYKTEGELSFENFLKVPLPKENYKNFDKKIISRISNSILFSPTIANFKNDWNWDFNEAVFQAGIFLEEFERMYLLRCLYRRENFQKKFLGWKVHLFRRVGDSKDLVNPFWNISTMEENILENFLKRIGFFPENISKNVNTPEKERKRRYEFQNNFEFSIKD